jgi:hypothetical protein
LRRAANQEKQKGRQAKPGGAAENGHYPENAPPFKEKNHFGMRPIFARNGTFFQVVCRFVVREKGLATFYAQSNFNVTA